MIRTTLLAISLALTATTAAGAGMYKWTDSSGKTQYGQFPPPGVQAERISPSGTTHKVEPQDARSPQQHLQELEEQQKKQGEQAAEAQTAQQRKELRNENCAIARKNLAVLQEGGHNRVRLPDGTVSYLTEEEKQQRIEQANQQIKDNCD